MSRKKLGKIKILYLSLVNLLCIYFRLICDINFYLIIFSGFSKFVLRDFKNNAAVVPSMTLWSQEMVTLIRCPIVIWSFITTGFLTIEPIASIALSGGFIIAEKNVPHYTYQGLIL